MAAAASAAAAVRGGEGDREAYVGVRGLKSKVRERVEGARKRERKRDSSDREHYKNPVTVQFFQKNCKFSLL